MTLTLEAINNLDITVKNNGALIETQRAPLLEQDLEVGKKLLAAAVTNKGVATSELDSLAEISDKIDKIIQSAPAIDGDTLYHRHLLGDAIYDIIEVALDLIDSGEYKQYKGAIVGRYYKGYESILLQNADAYLTSDGDFYTNLVTHYWHDEDSGKFDRYVIYFYTVDNYKAAFETNGLCPRDIVIVGNCDRLQINYNRLNHLWVLGTLGSFNCDTLGDPGGSWSGIQIIRNYKVHGAQGADVFFRGPSSGALTHIEFTDLEEIVNGVLFAPSTNCQSISFPSLKKISGGTVFSGGAYSWHNMNTVDFPVLEEVGTNGIVFSNSLFANIKKIYLPSLETVKGVLFSGPTLASLTSLELPALTTNSGTLISGTLNALTNLELPALTTNSGTLISGTLNALTNLELPALTTNSGLLIRGAANNLVQIDFPSLESIDGLILDTNNVLKLQCLNFPKVKTIFRYTYGIIRLYTYPALININFPELETINNAKFVENCICPALEELTFPKLTGIEITNGTLLFQLNSNAFSALKKLEFPELKTFVTSGGASANGYFLHGTKAMPILEGLSLPKLNKILCTNTNVLYSSFIQGLQSKITELEFPSLDYLNMKLLLDTTVERVLLPVIEYITCNGAYGSFNNCPTLKYIYLGYNDNDPTRGIYMVQANTPNVTDIELKEGFRKPLNISTFTALTKDNIVEHILKRLGDNTDNTTLTITLGATNLAKLTEDDKLIAVNKNYTLA